MSENVNHPELREGEVFLTNLVGPMPASMHLYLTTGRLIYVDCSKWKTVRRGEIAYNWKGRPLSVHVYPVFITRKELEESSVDADDPFGYLRAEKYLRRSD